MSFDGILVYRMLTARFPLPIACLTFPQFPVVVVLLANRDSHYSVCKNAVTSTCISSSEGRNSTMIWVFPYECFAYPRGGWVVSLALAPPWGGGARRRVTFQTINKVLCGEALPWGPNNLRRGTFLDFNLVEPLSRLFQSHKMHLLAFWVL